MSEIIPALQSLYKVLKASKAAEHFVKIEWENWPTMLSIRNAWGSECNDLIIHITLDEEHPEKFKYQALSNKGTNDSEKYLTIEEKKGVSQTVLLEVAYRLLTPQE